MNLFNLYIKDQAKKAKKRSIQRTQEFMEIRKRSAKLRAEFETDSRQQLRRLKFRNAFEEASERFPLEPRRARRKIARAWCKRGIPEV